jgi:hypothetical protein
MIMSNEEQARRMAESKKRMKEAEEREYARTHPWRGSSTQVRDAIKKAFGNKNAPTLGPSGSCAGCNTKCTAWMKSQCQKIRRKYDA